MFDSSIFFGILAAVAVIALMLVIVRSMVLQQSKEEAERKQRRIWRQGIDRLNSASLEHESARHRAEWILVELGSKTMMLDEAKKVLDEHEGKLSTDGWYVFAERSYIQAQVDQVELFLKLDQELDTMVRIRRSLEDFSFKETPDHVQLDAKRTIEYLMVRENKVIACKFATTRHARLSLFEISPSVDEKALAWRLNRNSVRENLHKQFKSAADERKALVRDRRALFAAVPSYSYESSDNAYL